MEILLKGRIKSLVKDFGFIYCETYKTDYFFHQTSIENAKEELKIGALVTFKLRAHRGREGSHAIEVKISKQIDKTIPNLEIKKKNKYFFDSKTDFVMGFRHIKKMLEFQKSKSEKKYEDSELINDQIDELLEIVNDILEGPSPNYEDISIEEINNSEHRGIELDRKNKNYWSKCFSLQEFGKNVESISSRETDKGSHHDFSILWHEWKDKEKQIFF